MLNSWWLERWLEASATLIERGHPPPPGCLIKAFFLPIPSTSVWGTCSSKSTPLERANVQSKNRRLLLNGGGNIFFHSYDHHRQNHHQLFHHHHHRYLFFYHDHRHYQHLKSQHFMLHYPPFPPFPFICCSQARQFCPSSGLGQALQEITTLQQTTEQRLQGFCTEMQQ